MHIVSYNIHYGVGADDALDIDRIARELGAGGETPDVIALQEVVRNFVPHGIEDHVADLEALFPDHEAVYGPALDVGLSAYGAEGDNRRKRLQFGNMLLSRWPIVSARNHILPKHDPLGAVSIQRAALEGVLAAPTGPVRVYNLHLAHASSDERQAQIDALLAVVTAAPAGGGVWSGDPRAEGVFVPVAPPPMPAGAILIGDFNAPPSEANYQRVLDGGFTDAWTAAGHGKDEGVTCDGERIDHIFVNSAVGGAVERVWIDDTTRGSDHFPLHAVIA